MIAAIVCADMNNAIGYKGELLERIPEDMKYFKELTTGNVVIMGRKTWDSLPDKPLKNRTNWIITSRYNPNNPYRSISLNDPWPVYADLAQVIDAFRIFGYKTIEECKLPNIFIIGGGQTYKELLPYCDCVCLTRILHKYPNADTYFPDIESTPEWKCVSCSEVKQWNDVQYQFELYKRIEGES